MTQEDLSLESTVSRSHIAMIEAGKRDITISALFKISRALNSNMQQIFDFDDVENTNLISKNSTNNLYLNSN